MYSTSVKYLVEPDDLRGSCNGTLADELWILLYRKQEEIRATIVSHVYFLCSFLVSVIFYSRYSSEERRTTRTPRVSVRKKIKNHTAVQVFCVIRSTGIVYSVYGKA